MKTILVFALVILAAAWMLKDAPIAGHAKLHFEAFQRHLLQVTAEKAKELAIAQKQEPLFAAIDIFQQSDEGVRTIPKGSLIHITEMSGDQITITNGLTIITTTPDAITPVPPQVKMSEITHHPESGLNHPLGMHPPLAQTSPSQVSKDSSGSELLNVVPETPQNAHIRARIAELDSKIETLERYISESQGSQKSIHVTRAQRELSHLMVQRDNFMHTLAKQSHH